jgi:hypothetical protein
MDLSEIEFFIKKYNTQIFNTHSNKEYPIPQEWVNMLALLPWKIRIVVI